MIIEMLLKTTCSLRNFQFKTKEVDISPWFWSFFEKPTLMGHKATIRNYIRVGFLIEPSLKPSPNHKMLPSSEKGNIPTKINSQVLNPLFCDFFGKLCNLRQRCRNCDPSTWIYTHQHMSNQKFQQVFRGYDAFECHANFQINWESFAHRDQPKEKQHI